METRILTQSSFITHFSVANTGRAIEVLLDGLDAKISSETSADNTGLQDTTRSTFSFFPTSKVIQFTTTPYNKASCSLSKLFNHSVHKNTNNQQS